jgi:hypothetical protein
MKDGAQERSGGAKTAGGEVRGDEERERGGRGRHMAENNKRREPDMWQVVSGR